MSYAVKEIFLTLQGEGVRAGRRAVFLRFAGCNLWTGREQDREEAICRFCDTDFVGMDGENGARYQSADDLARRVEMLWGDALDHRYVVLTGGEPMLQVDDDLVDALHRASFEIALETNGTIAAHRAIDWVCVSPKAGSQIVQKSGQELKMVWPQPDHDWQEMEQWAFDHFLVQPMDGVDRDAALAAAIDFAMVNPQWRLSLQNHKTLGLP